jgi:hypothetical protein
VHAVTVELIEEVPREQRHLSLLLPLFTEERGHAIYASFNVFHAPVGVDAVELELRIFVRQVLALVLSLMLGI